MSTPNDRELGLTTHCSPVDRWALVCITCEVVLSVAAPVGFSGVWLYPHPDHERHELATINPAGERVDQAAVATIVDEPAAAPGAPLIAAALTASPRPTRARPIRHGTNGGYSAHLKRGIPPCDACRRARTAYQRRYMRAVRQLEQDEPVYVCNECDFTTQHLRWIARHTWSEHERPPTGAERRSRKRAAS